MAFIQFFPEILKGTNFSFLESLCVSEVTTSLKTEITQPCNCFWGHLDLKMSLRALQICRVHLISHPFAFSAPLKWVP